MALVASTLLSNPKIILIGLGLIVGLIVFIVWRIKRAIKKGPGEVAKKGLNFAKNFTGLDEALNDMKGGKPLKAYLNVVTYGHADKVIGGAKKIVKNLSPRLKKIKSRLKTSTKKFGSKIKGIFRRKKKNTHSEKKTILSQNIDPMKGRRRRYSGPKVRMHF